MAEANVSSALSIASTSSVFSDMTNSETPAAPYSATDSAVTRRMSRRTCTVANTCSRGAAQRRRPIAADDYGGMGFLQRLRRANEIVKRKKLACEARTLVNPKLAQYLPQPLNMVFDNIQHPGHEIRCDNATRIADRVG